MKKLILLSILLGALYSQCNESNWEEYYPNMQECDLAGADLIGANLSGADLSGADLMFADLCNLTASPSGDVCEESGGITDDNGDGYDDESYDAGADSVNVGDGNGDGEMNILDMVMFIQMILDGE